MKNQLVVYTPNPKKGTGVFKMNVRFGLYYKGDEDNWDRLCLVGIPNESTKELSIGISFCCFPDNFDKIKGYDVALSRAEYSFKRRPYAVITIEDFTQANCLQVLYDLHAELVSKSIKEVKRLVNTQIVK